MQSAKCRGAKMRQKSICIYCEASPSFFVKRKRRGDRVSGGWYNSCRENKSDANIILPFFRLEKREGDHS